MNTHTVLQELCQEALIIQDRYNLPEVVRMWAKSIGKLKEALGNVDIVTVNNHPINILYADRVAQLTNLCVADRTPNYVHAHDYVFRMSK